MIFLYLCWKSISYLKIVQPDRGHVSANVAGLLNKARLFHVVNGDSHVAMFSAGGSKLI